MKIKIVFLVLMLGSGQVAGAHGMELDVVASGPAWIVRAQYDEDRPMASAAVTINAPNEPALFQRGQTDRNGKFVFIPDKAGKWSITVDDGAGHRLLSEITVKATAELQPHAAEHLENNRFLSLLAGVAIILGLTIVGFRLLRLRHSGSS